MKPDHTVLVVVGDSAAESISSLEQTGLRQHVVRDPLAALNYCQVQPPAVAVLDLDIKTPPGAALLHGLSRCAPAVAVVALSSNETKLASAAKDAFMVMPSPCAASALNLAVRRAYEHWMDQWELDETDGLAASVINNCPNPLLVLNPDTSIRLFNPALQRLVGFHPSRILGQKFPYPWWPPDAVQNRPVDFSRAPGQRCQAMTAFLQKADGQRFWAHIAFAPVYMDGDLTHYVVNWGGTPPQCLAPVPG